MSYVQRKTKGQQLKGKIVSEFPHYFINFTLFLIIFPLGLPLQNKGLWLKENKREEKIIKSTGQIDVAR